MKVIPLKHNKKLNLKLTSSMSTLDDFEVLQKIGSGSFSCVYKVKRIEDGNIYAMKKVQLNMLKEKEKENALNEVRILASLNQKYVIGYKEALFDEASNCLCIVMEYAEGGDISHMIKNKVKQQKSFDEQEIWKALVHMTYGLKTLHDKSILHRDLKCANVFCTLDGIFKLGDLNVSKIAKRGMLYTQTGTPCISNIEQVDYASPEIWRDEPYDAKSDIWSLGCVIYEMCQLRPPFMANDMPGLYSKIQKGVYPAISNKFSYGLQQVITQMLRLNASTRPSCDQILHNPHVLSNGADYLEYQPQPKLSLLQTIQLPREGQYRLLSDKLPGRKYTEKTKDEKEIKAALQYNKENKENCKKFIEKLNISYQKKKNLTSNLDLSLLRDKQTEKHPVTEKPSEDYLAPSKNQSSPVHMIKKYMYDGSPKQITHDYSKIQPRNLNKPPIMKRNSPTNRVVMVEDKRLHRISSVQVDSPHEHHPTPIDYRRKVIRRPTSQYLQDEQSELQSQVSKKEKHLVQPLHKQFSDQTPFKNTPKKEHYLNNKPYLNELPRLNFYKEVEELSQRKLERRQSPYMAPKVVISRASPFQIDRKIFNNNVKRRINVSYLHNEHYLFD